MQFLCRPLLFFNPGSLSCRWFPLPRSRGPDRWISYFLGDHRKPPAVLCPALAASTAAFQCQNICLERDVVNHLDDFEMLFGKTGHFPPSPAAFAPCPACHRKAFALDPIVSSLAFLAFSAFSFILDEISSIEAVSSSIGARLFARALKDSAMLESDSCLEPIETCCEALFISDIRLFNSYAITVIAFSSLGISSLAPSVYED